MTSITTEGQYIILDGKYRIRGIADYTPYSLTIEVDKETVLEVSKAIADKKIVEE